MHSILTDKCGSLDKSFPAHSVGGGSRTVAGKQTFKQDAKEEWLIEDQVGLNLLQFKAHIRGPNGGESEADSEDLETRFGNEFASQKDTVIKQDWTACILLTMWADRCKNDCSNKWLSLLVPLR
jgi:hypothetical protein